MGGSVRQGRGGRAAAAAAPGANERGAKASRSAGGHLKQAK